MWIRSISIYSDLLADTWGTEGWLQMKSKIDTIWLLSKSIKLTPDRVLLQLGYRQFQNSEALRSGPGLLKSRTPGLSIRLKVDQIGAIVTTQFATNFGAPDGTNWNKLNSSGLKNFVRTLKTQRTRKNRKKNSKWFAERSERIERKLE